jgi:hypothetical protein
MQDFDEFKARAGCANIVATNTTNAIVVIVLLFFNLFFSPIPSFSHSTSSLTNLASFAEIQILISLPAL